MTSMEHGSLATASVDDLRAGLEVGTPAYVLIDPMLGEPLPDIQYTPDTDMDALQAVRERVWNRPTFIIPLDCNVPLEACKYPYLVALEDGQEDEWLATTLELALQARDEACADGLSGTGAAAMPVGGWLVSSMRSAELTEFLSSLFRPDTEARTRARYLRLPDPRVFEWTQRVVGKARLSAALGRVQRWHTVDAMQRLTTATSLGENSSPLRFSQTEWQKMERGHEAHPAVAMAIGASGCRQLSGDPYERILLALDLADSAARRWPQRFRERRDWQVWIALGLSYGDPAAVDAVRKLMDSPPEDGEPPEPVGFLAEALSAAMCNRPTSDAIQSN